MEESENLLQACMRTIQQQTFYNAYWKAFKVMEAGTDDLRQQAFRLRYQVYCTEGPGTGAGDDPAQIERDAYDDRAIHYLLIHNATGQAAGAVRVLLPRASAPLNSFEMQKLCSHPLLENEERAQHMAEISRLCMAWQFRRRPGDGRILPAYFEQESEHDIMPLGKPFSIRRRITYAPLGLIKAAFEAVMDRGILDCIALMDPNDFRSLKRLGLTYKILGPRVTAYGSQQPIIFNIKAALDNMEAANPECWEIVTDKGRLARRASELQLETWNDTVFDEPAKHKLMSRIF
jgi:N-acyl amino acid synthase of PEP-CTERM/exosortase system